MAEETNMSQTEAVETASVSNKKRNPMTIILLGALGALLVVGIGGSYLFTKVSVKKISTSSVVTTLADIYNVSAFSVNGTNVPYSSYVEGIKMMKFISTFDKSGSLSGATDADISDIVLSQLTVETVMKDLAKQYNVTVTEEDINKEVELTKQKIGDIKEIEQQVQAAFKGMSLDTFIKIMVTPSVVNEKVASAYTSTLNEPKAEELKQKAEEVLKKIQDGTKFEDMAAEFGSDSTKEKGGDLGWFGKGVMVPAFEEKIFSMKVGELGIVETDFGYHIVKLEEKRINKDTKAEEAHARHILFPFSTATAQFETMVGDILRKATYELYIPVRNPFAPTDTATLGEPAS